jgi:transposase
MNRIRGLLAEFGIVIAKSEIALRRALGEILEHEDLPRQFVELLQGLREHWQQIQSHRHVCDQRIQSHADTDEHCRRVRALNGIGPLTADAVVASVGDGRDYKNGRQMAAWLGLVPCQHSSGGHQRLGHISRSGDAYLRTLLIQGARSSVLQASRASPGKATPEQIWINQLATRMPFGKLLVAIANKHVRQLWAMLARGDAYDPNAWLRHPMVQRNALRTNTLEVAS